MTRRAEGVWRTSAVKVSVGEEAKVSFQVAGVVASFCWVAFAAASSAAELSVGASLLRNWARTELAKQKMRQAMKQSLCIIGLPENIGGDCISLASCQKANERGKAQITGRAF